MKQQTEKVLSPPRKYYPQARFLLPLGLVLLTAPCPGFAAQEQVSVAEASLEETAVQPESGTTLNWVDSSHEYATNRAQALAQWMDDFFGATVNDVERADTFVRVITVDDWDQRDGHDMKLRLRGQVNLPKISERVDLFFSGEEVEQTLTEDERARENDVGLRFNFRDDKRSRFDATLTLRGGPALLPGVRYRYQRPITDNSWARFTQRFQYHTADGYRSLTNFEINRAISDRSVLRLSSRVRYREDREFWDWNTGLSYRYWFDDHEKFPSAIEYFAVVSGRDQPETFATSYRLGFLYRRQFLREFLFYEVEPSYNLRRDTYEEERKGVFGVVLRLEVMLDSDLVRRRRAR